MLTHTTIVATQDNRGNEESEQGDYKAALADYDKAVELNPEDADAFNRGAAKDALDDHKGAIADHNKARELNPQHADT